jgi:hypothetical protein
MKEFRILITGSRTWRDFLRIRLALGDVLSEINDPNVIITIVHGACPSGADFLASEWVKLIRHDYRYTIMEERHRADWKRYRKSAGYIRNAKMVSLGADIVLAFIHNESKGASHTARTAEKAGLTVRYFIATS